MPNDTRTDAAILERFAEIVATSLRIDASQVTEDAYLDDLGAESLDLLEITMEAEEEFSILIPQKNILQTAQEVVGEGVLVRDGRLTDAGTRLLRSRLPEFAPPEGGELSVAQLNRTFMQVGTWVRMISRLVEHTPTACPCCGAPFGKQLAGRLTCQACAAEHDIPSGDDLNRAWVDQYCREEFHLPPTPSAT
jgi:acyl carrier protein